MLQIGEKQYTTKKINAKFPITFYKETGIDVFKIEGMQDRPMDLYEALLNLAFYMIDDFEGTLDDFADEVTMLDVMTSSEAIMSTFYGASNGTSKSAEKSKK